MCLQKITISSDSTHLDFLSNCEPDKAYPPLRLYEDDGFIVIYAKDRNQISISKTGFEVEIDGTNYTDIDLALDALNPLIKTVNQSASSGGGGASGGSTEPKQDDIIVQNATLIAQGISIIGQNNALIAQGDAAILQNQELIHLASGSNTTTKPAAHLTNANSTGTYYTLFSIKCNRDGVMYLKGAETLATTNDQSHICIFKNPTIGGAALIYTTIGGFPNIQEGHLPALTDPTDQVVTLGTCIDSFYADRNNLITKKHLNRKVEFLNGDEFVFAVDPKSSNLDIEGLCSLLIL